MKEIVDIDTCEILIDLCDELKIKYNSFRWWQFLKKSKYKKLHNIAIKQLYDSGQVFCVLGWDLKPTTSEDGIHVLPRSVENIINSKYYPENKNGEFPVNPKTGEKLPIAEDYKYIK